MSKHPKPTCPSGTARDAIFGLLIVMAMMAMLFIGFVAWVTST